MIVKKCCCNISLRVGVLIIIIVDIITILGNLGIIYIDDHGSEFVYAFYCSEVFAIFICILLMMTIFYKHMSVSTKRLLILPWLVYNAIYCILISITIISLIILSIVAGKAVVGLSFIIFATFFTIYLPLLLYSWIVVYSYYQSFGYSVIHSVIENDGNIQEMTTV